MNNYGTLASRYAYLSAERTAPAQRARDAAALSIPSLLMPLGATQATKLPTPYQGLGARAVNILAAKLLLALLPSNMSFYRLGIDELTLKKLAQNADAQNLITESLAKMERTIQTSIEASSLRSKLSEALKQLIVAGNVAINMTDFRKPRVFKMDSYVIRRDAVGHVLEAIMIEKINPMALPDDVRQACDIPPPQVQDRDLELYTGIRWDGDKYEISQEVNGNTVPGSTGTYATDNLPWLFLRFFSVDGESYGRGYFEEYIGDFKSLEGLSKAIVQGSAAASKVVFFVKPGSATNRSAVANARNGDFVNGDRNDVGTLQLDKFNDFRVAQETISQISERLAYAFLMSSAIQRNGERVTAEEIRYMAQELEDGLGGIYSVLSQELQLPLINTIMRQMQRDGELPALPKQLIKVSITTGMEALGRGQDADRLRTFVADVAQLGPEAFSTLRIGTLLSRLAVSRGIDTDGLIKTPEEVQQEQQQAQLAQMAANVGQNVGPDLVKQAMGIGPQQ